MNTTKTSPQYPDPDDYRPGTTQEPATEEEPEADLEPAEEPEPYLSCLRTLKPHADHLSTHGLGELPEPVELNSELNELDDWTNRRYLCERLSQIYRSVPSLKERAERIAHCADNLVGTIHQTSLTVKYRPLSKCGCLLCPACYDIRVHAKRKTYQDRLYQILKSKSLYCLAATLTADNTKICNLRESLLNIAEGLRKLRRRSQLKSAWSVISSIESTISNGECNPHVHMLILGATVTTEELTDVWQQCMKADHPLRVQAERTKTPLTWNRYISKPAVSITPELLESPGDVLELTRQIDRLRLWECTGGLRTMKTPISPEPVQMPNRPSVMQWNGNEYYHYAA